MSFIFYATSIGLGISSNYLAISRDIVPTHLVNFTVCMSATFRLVFQFGMILLFFYINKVVLSAILLLVSLLLFIFSNFSLPEMQGLMKNQIVKIINPDCQIDQRRYAKKEEE